MHNPEIFHGVWISKKTPSLGLGIINTRVITCRGKLAVDAVGSSVSSPGSDPLTTLSKRDTQCGVLREQQMTGDTAIPRMKPSLAQSLCC